METIVLWKRHKKYIVIRLRMIERKEKSPEQVSDEDYKIAPTSVDREVVASTLPAMENKKQKQVEATGANGKSSDDNLQEELREGVE